MTLNERIEYLEARVKSLEGQLSEGLKDNTDALPQPISVDGNVGARGNSRPIDIRSGLSQVLGGSVVWNNTEIDATLVAEPDAPSKGYNKHSHSRYSGGALISDVLEIVSYVWGSITNKHSQQYYSEQPEIQKVLNSKGEAVEMIGGLDLGFDPDTQKWTVRTHEIDVEKCVLVKRDIDGNVELDLNGNPKSSPLYNSDVTKTSIVWDESALVWRLLAVYAQA